MKLSDRIPSLFSYENRLLVLLFCVFGCVFVDRLALSFLFPMISQELNLTNAHLGTLSAVLALMWALSGAGLGAISDRYNIRKPMLIGAVVTFSLFSGLSGVVSSFAMLLLFRALMGIAEGPVLPIAQSLMVDASQAKRRGLNMGLIQGSAPGLVGAIIAPPLIIAIAMHFGWRAAFFTTAIPGLVLAWLIYKYVHVNKGLWPTTALPGTSESQGSRVSYAELFKIKNILLCILISCCFVSWFILIMTFTPTFLVQARGFSEQSMGKIMSAIGLAWVFWGVAVPAISDRLGRKPTLIFFSLIAVSCPFVLSYVNDPLLLGGLVFLTYTGLGCFTLFMATIPSETVTKTMIATALGLIMGIGEVVGGCLVPFISGFLADSYGLNITMWIAAAGSILACVLAFFLEETAPVVVKKRALPGQQSSPMN